MRTPRSILVTGGAGFIGSNLVRYLLAHPGFDGRVVCLDKLTYAGNPANLVLESSTDRFHSYTADLCDTPVVERVLRDHEVDTILHLAAETHVDRAIEDDAVFARTNVLGTHSLLVAARAAWRGRTNRHFHQVSTDEVFGPAPVGVAFHEESPYAPRNPYAASKAAADHFVRAAAATHGLPATISCCSNNYGPRQHPEKLVPRMILALLEGRPLPVYGDGQQRRDWLHVEDHCAALWAIATSGVPGETYLLPGGNEWRNIDLVRRLVALVARRTGRAEGALSELITHVPDRPGHDARYCLDGRRTSARLGWSPRRDPAAGLESTVDWYLGHADWVSAALSHRG